MPACDWLRVGGQGGGARKSTISSVSVEKNVFFASVNYTFTLLYLENITKHYKNLTSFLEAIFNTDQVQGWWSKEFLCSFTSLTINYTWEDNSNEPFHCQCDSLSAPQRKKEREPLSKTFLNTFSGKLWTTYFPKEKAWQVGLNTKTLCFTETCSKEPAHLNWLFFWRAHKLCSIRRGNI